MKIRAAFSGTAGILDGIVLLLPVAAVMAAAGIPQPVVIGAATCSGRSGTLNENCAEGGRDVTAIRNGNYLQFQNVDFGSGMQCFEARVASAGGGGGIELHLDNPGGTLVGTCEVRPSTGGSQTWTSKACAVNGVSGIHTLYLVFTGDGGTLFSLEWFKLYPVRGISVTGWRQSTAGAIGRYRGTLQFGPDSASAPAATGTTAVIIDTASLLQRIDGFGGAFNDIGWVSLQEIAPSAKDSIMRALFDTSTGCKFTIGRCPIGMSDFSVDSTSLDDSANDFSMRYFSVAHDLRYNIPYIKEAMKYQKNLMIYSSPWTPPSWLKTTGTWQGTTVGINDSLVNRIIAEGGIPSDSSDINDTAVSQMKQDSQSLASYAVYLRKFVQAFDSVGISIMAVFPQNELDVVIPGHPSCQWTGARLWNFTRNYLSRDFSTHGITAELWMGTYNISDSADDLAPWLYDSLNRLVRGAGFQWGGYTAMGQMLAADSSLHLRAWETENMCHTGANSWTDAMDMYCSYMYPYFQKGANSYQNWNMILNVDPAFVPWIPRYQNSMITITSSTGTVTYNPEFFVMKHFSYYIKQGAVRMPVSTGNAALWPLAFKNPDGTVITLIANSADTAIATSIQIGNSAVTLTLPAGSINTFDMGGTEDTTDWVPGGTAVRLTPQSGSTRAVPAAFTIFDIAGRIIRQDVTGRVGRGATTLHWDGIDDDGRRVARGVYFAAARGAKTASRLFFTGNDWAVLAPATR